ncbi:MAG TPA: serine/threonine-protein kinase [Dokdonella sp.]|uniref:serine/threonine protein kinase n=1 Tax=Dokdonella sp. TaxID=2291710 RepID=UPI002D7FAD91|nr:serine/threonine-protein kinase [Dokdonella sp.]HET9032029.1 serine/threonine-protein kinase [Dokdonella sp.]
MNSRCADLLREALDLPETERQAFLEQVSAGDESLRACLLRLLELDTDVDPFLDAPLDGVIAGLMANQPVPAEDLDDVAIGQRIGPWKVISKLGSGGMGSVWLAERADGVFSQSVALKTIKLGMDSALVLAQFRRERDLLARLQHPNIASLIDGGVDDRGRPWFAMDHVSGVELREWIKTKPPLADRLHLFEKLCRAVSYAHQQLVIHRDIKPGNVMVQPDGEPKLLDFGIAKLLAEDDPDETVTLYRFASRSYAAPEQWRGEAVSTVTDVYSLGALLFEMLTGERYASLHQDTTTPMPPSHAARLSPGGSAVLATGLRGDLDAIVTRALAEEPTRRYPSVLSMAEDVSNYLSGRPVHARPDSGWYRLRKLVVRNRVASMALVAAVLALIAGLTISVRQTSIAEQQARRAEAVTHYLTGLFDSGRSNSGGTQVRDRTVQTLLEDSANQLRGKLEKQPDVRDELYTILVEIFDSNDLPERSLTLAQERVDSAEAAWGVNDARVAPALIMLAGVSINHGKLDQVPELLQRAEKLLDAARDHESLARAQLLRWQGFYTYVVEDHPVYEGNPLIASVALLRNHYAENDELLSTLYQLTMLAMADHKYAPAQNAIDEMRLRAKARYGGHNMYSTIADFSEANLNLRSGSPDKAYEIGTRGIEDVRHFEGEHHHDVLQFQNLRILALLKGNRLDEARAIWKEADAQRQRDWPDDEELRATFSDLEERLH